jgi:hypothetical protein
VNKTKTGNTLDPMYLLDTDVLIDVQRNFPAAVAWLSSLIETPSVPGFVVWS